MNHFFTRAAVDAEFSCASSNHAAAAVAPMQLNLETRVDCVHYTAHHVTSVTTRCISRGECVA